MALSKYFIREKQDEKTKAKVGAAEAPASPSTKAKDQGPEEIDILDALLMGKELVTTLDTKYGDFEYKYPDGNDMLRIGIRRAEFMGGYPEASFDRSRLVLFEYWATLDVLVKKKPEKFSKIMSWADFPDQDLVFDLYSRGAQFCSEIREQIRGPKR